MATEQRVPPDDARPPRPVARLRQRRAWGRLLQAVGYFSLATGTASGAYAYTALRGFEAQHGWAAVALASALMAALLGLGRWAIRQGSRHTAELLPSITTFPEEERIVLYLRSFTDDDEFARIDRGSYRDGPWAATPDTEEQQLATATAPFGRMVALGGPDDRLPHVGASRSYASDKAWQAEVLAGLDRASLVLLACGPGEGLVWEVARVVERGRPERLVLVVGRDERQYESFRAAAAHLFPGGLPALCDESIELDTGAPDGNRHHIRSVVWFDPDWTPHLRPLGGKDPEVEVWKLTDPHRWIETAFPLALRPVYQRAGLPVPGLPAARLARPAAVGVSVVLLGLTLLGLLPSLVDSDRDELATFMIFIALPVGVLLYRVGRGGHVAVLLAKMYGGLVASVGFLLVVLHLVLGGVPTGLFPGLLVGVVGIAGTLLLSRTDVREWVASGALRAVSLPSGESDGTDPDGQPAG